MKVYAEKLVEAVVDKICDVCAESVMIEMNSEKCFKTALYALRDKRRGTFMLDDEKFGLDPELSPQNLKKLTNQNTITYLKLLNCY